MTPFAEAQAVNSILITDSRPLAGALDALEKMTGTPLNYEDPPYQNQSDLQDVSTPQQRLASPGYRNLVPRIGSMSVAIPASLFTNSAGASVSAANALFAANLLLTNYRQSALPGDFQLEQANGMIYVVPTKILGSGGSLLPVTSPMMTPVTIPNGQRSICDTAQAILDAVSTANGLRIFVGALPFWPGDVVSFGANGETARDALARLFAQVGQGTLSYRLLFDPKADTMRTFDYIMNIQRAGSSVPTAPAVRAPIAGSPSAQAGSAQSSAGNPAFVQAPQ
jgi:hypothetical protein